MSGMVTFIVSREEYMEAKLFLYSPILFRDPFGILFSDTNWMTTRKSQSNSIFLSLKRIKKKKKPSFLRSNMKQVEFSWGEWNRL